MPAPEPRVPVLGPCVFGAGRLLPLIDVTSKEITGVRDDDDIEHIHRMRVASRRLRAALPLFSSCFPEKDFRHWMHEIKSVTRALGEARDTDVQIAFLKKYLKDQAVPVPADMTGPAPAQSYAGDPIAALLSRLQKRRGLLQQQVISALDELEETQVLSGIQAACPVPAAAGRGRRRARYFGVLPVAADRIGRRLAGLDRFEPFVHNPDAVFEHHAMRIAAKKLRYTLETYAPLYRRELKKPIARIKRLQDLLGDIHDCDVWIEQMTLAIIKQRTHRYPKGDLPGTAVSAVAPLRRLLVNRERCRARLYRQFVRVPGTPLSVPGSGASCAQRCWKDSGHQSATDPLIRLKRSVQRLFNVPLWRPNTLPMAARSQHFPFGCLMNLLPFTGLAPVTVRCLIMPQPSTISAGWTGRPGTRRGARN